LCSTMLYAFLHTGHTKTRRQGGRRDSSRRSADIPLLLLLLLLLGSKALSHAAPAAAGCSPSRTTCPATAGKQQHCRTAARVLRMPCCSNPNCCTTLLSMSTMALLGAGAQGPHPRTCTAPQS
jgi:hypothetical protein